MAGGTLRQAPPRLYQQGVGGRRTVPGHYMLAGPRRGQSGWAVRVAPGRYDRGRPLVIDPPLSYATYLGGGDYDTAFGVAVDGDGSAYIAGDTCSGNFPRTVSLGRGSGPNCANGARTDAYVTKLDAAGSAVVYSAYLGGSNQDVGHAVAVDSAGDAYVAGSTNSTDFPATIGSVQQHLAGYIGANDVFVAKLAPVGNGLLYATYKGGGGDDYAMGIAVDSSRNAFVTGFTASNDFGATANAAQQVFAGSTDAFLFELDASAQSVTYSTYLGGQGSTYSMGVALDDSDSAYIVGFTTAPDLPLRNPYQTQVGNVSVFVARIASSGALAYSTYLGGDGYDYGYGIAVDSAGDAFITGLTSSTTFPITQHWTPIQESNHVGYDAFVTELGPSGSSLVFSTYLGGSRDDYGSAIALDSQDDVYVTGWTASRDFPSVAAPQATYGGGAYDAFAVELAESNPPLQGAEQIAYSTYLGGGDDDHPYGIAVDNGGNAYVVGATASYNFPTLGAFQSGYQGADDDAFAVEIDPCGKPPHQLHIDCTAVDNSNPPPPIPTTPIASVSYYMTQSTATNAQYMYNLGHYNGNVNGVILLDFGAGDNNGGVYGTDYPGTGTPVSIYQITQAVQYFVQGYYEYNVSTQSSEPTWRVGNGREGTGVYSRH